MVYRKSTYILSTISAGSHHPWNYKIETFRSFMNRAFSHCSNNEKI
uniref:Down-regulated in metastasis-like protein n=1 Tax=Cyriopagopus schmidti TaxID=29017 RepID=B5M6G1_CYRSC|nr:down-regulated in metastasis-like protein [Cyriopagopus schmidti]